MRKTYKSVMHEDKRGYHFTQSSTDNWEKRGNHALITNVTMFETYGDSLTQHSGDWCPAPVEFTDVCLSLAAAILAEPFDDELTWLHMTLNPVGHEAIAFAMSVKHKEDKRQWYSLSLRKVTTADKAAYDKRYEEVKSHHDGGIKSVLHILNCSHWDVIQWVALVVSVREYFATVAGKGYTSYEDIDPFFGKLTGDWSQSFRALYCAVEAVQQLSNSKRTFDCAVNNSKPRGRMAVAAAEDAIDKSLAELQPA